MKSMGNTSRHVASGDVQASSCSTKAKSGKATRLLLNPFRIRPIALVQEGVLDYEANSSPGRRARGPPGGGAREFREAQLGALGDMGLRDDEEVPLPKETL